jgi:cyclophilin family peptidyl-prolyl cis-trans isomerase
VFGKVTSGMDVVMKIGKTRCDANDNPVTPVMMKSVTIS